jgi:hypothetical protein
MNWGSIEFFGYGIAIALGLAFSVGGFARKEDGSYTNAGLGSAGIIIIFVALVVAILRYMVENRILKLGRIMGSQKPTLPAAQLPFTVEQ